jgi:hypothetical protein
VERDYYMELDSCRVCAGLVDMVFITCRRMLQSEFRFNFMILVRSNVRANMLVGHTLLSSRVEDDGARRRIRIALRLLPLGVVSAASETIRRTRSVRDANVRSIRTGSRCSSAAIFKS